MTKEPGFLRGEDGNPNYYRRLSRNIALVMVGVSLIPLVLIGGVLLRHFGDSYHQKVHAYLDELIQKHSQNIDGFLTARLADIRVMARSNNPDRLRDGDFLGSKLNLLREEYGGVYVDLGLIDSEGIQVAYAGPFNLVRANYAEADWFKKSLKSEHFISDVFTGLRGSPHFIVAVKQLWRGRDWILRATIDFEAFNSLVGNIRLGNTGFAFILNRAGDFQSNSHSGVVIDRRLFLDLLKHGIGSNQVKIVERTDETDRKLLIAMAPLKSGQWVLVCQQDMADAFAEVREAERLAAAIFLLGGLAIVVVAFFLSKRMVIRIAEANKEKAIMHQQIIDTGRLASIGELAAGIAHEINNPIAIMVEEAGWIEDMLEDEDLSARETTDEVLRAVRQIDTQGGRCKEITHKLLSFARKTDPDIREVDLNRLVTDSVELLEQKARYANVTIETDLAAGLPAVAASPSELQQVFLNLINNAVAAIDNVGGGLVTLTSQLAGGEVVLEVADTGQGIPEANLGRIFDPFFTTKPVGQGTGLGLSICYGIVDKLGGALSVESEVGSGTLFTIRLPVAERPGQTTETSDPDPSRGNAPTPGDHSQEDMP